MMETLDFAPTNQAKYLVLPDWRDDSGKWAQCKSVGGMRYRSRSYMAWRNMTMRCGIGKKTIRKAYQDCTIHPDFLDFQKFCGWYVAQPGYLADGYVLDKDILSNGKKQYGPENCVLIPAALNNFMAGAFNSRVGNGVNVSRRDGRYRVDLSFDNKKIWVGYFDCFDKAVEAYRKRKAEYALVWVDRIKTGNMPIDERVISLLENWEASFPTTDRASTGKDTVKEATK